MIAAIVAFLTSLLSSVESDASFTELEVVLFTFVFRELFAVRGVSSLTDRPSVGLARFGVFVSIEGPPLRFNSGAMADEVEKIDK